MNFSSKRKIALAVVLALCAAGGVTAVVRNVSGAEQTNVTGYFENSNGIFPGDDVMILGVTVGKIDKIEPQPLHAKITFSFDNSYKVPADAKAVILSPTLVTARAIQLTPPYSGGPTMSDGAVIPQDRTAVPVEFDELREQLEKLTQTLQPTEPGGVSTLGALVNSAADNLRGQGLNIRDTVIQLSQALSALGDHSADIFGTIKNLAIVVRALQSSTDLLRDLNGNLASVTGLLANDHDEVGNAVKHLNDALADLNGFIADNRPALGTTVDKLASVSQALVDSLDDIKQTLHIAPNAFANFTNIYEPASASLTGILAINNFADPVSFICSAVQAASRLGNEQAAKLCVQYLAPIVKNRQYNYPPLGENFFVGAQARPNEVTFSEDWLRPLTEAGRIRDYYEGPLPSQGAPPGAASDPGAYPADATATDPAAGLPGVMVPPGVGS